MSSFSGMVADASAQDLSTNSKHELFIPAFACRRKRRGQDPHRSSGAVFVQRCQSGKGVQKLG